MTRLGLITKGPINIGSANKQAADARAKALASTTVNFGKQACLQLGHRSGVERVVLFLIGLRILQDVVPVLLSVGVAIAAIVLVAWSLGLFFDWAPSQVAEIVGTVLLITVLVGVPALLVGLPVAATVWDIFKQVRPNNKKPPT